MQMDKIRTSSAFRRHNRRLMFIVASSDSRRIQEYIRLVWLWLQPATRVQLLPDFKLGLNIEIHKEETMEGSFKSCPPPGLLGLAVTVVDPGSRICFLTNPSEKHRG